MELLGQLVLPLLDQAAGRDDEAALEVAADQQLLDQKPGHDGLAGAGIVGEQEAQRLARQHLAVDGGDLVRQRLDQRGRQRQVGIEQVGQPDALGLGREPEQVAIAAERPRPARSNQLERRLVAAVDQPVANRPARLLERDLDRLVAEPLDLDDLRHRAGHQAAHRRSGAQLLEAAHEPHTAMVDLPLALQPSTAQGSPMSDGIRSRRVLNASGSRREKPAYLDRTRVSSAFGGAPRRVATKVCACTNSARPQPLIGEFLGKLPIPR